MLHVHDNSYFADFLSNSARVFPPPTNMRSVCFLGGLGPWIEPGGVFWWYWNPNSAAPPAPDGIIGRTRRITRSEERPLRLERPRDTIWLDLVIIYYLFLLFFRRSTFWSNCETWFCQVDSMEDVRERKARLIEMRRNEGKVVRAGGKHADLCFKTDISFYTFTIIFIILMRHVSKDIYCQATITQKSRKRRILRRKSERRWALNNFFRITCIMSILFQLKKKYRDCDGVSQLLDVSLGFHKYHLCSPFFNI